nr:hypothetical protein [Tanacetum cinerariifolium]
SLNSRNKNVDTFPRYKNDNPTEQFRNQRTLTVTGAKETVGSQVKDYTYHKEKMLMCKQAKKGVSLQAEQADWLANTDEEIDKQELEAHYSYMAKIQEVPTTDSGTDTEPLEQVQYDVEYNMFANERQHFEKLDPISNTCVVEKVDSNVIPNSQDMYDNDIQTDQNAEDCDDERVALANLIANLKLDVDKNKKIQKKIKKANTSLAHELKECKSILAETSRTLRESNSIQDSCLIALQNKQIELETYKTLNDCTVDYDKLERPSKEKTKVIEDLKLKEEKDIDKMISMEKQLKFLNEIVYKRNQSIQTIHMLAPKGSTFIDRLTFANLMYLKKAQSEKPCLELVDHAWEKHSHDHFRAPTTHDMEILIKTCLMPLVLKTQNVSFNFSHELKQEIHVDLKYVESLEKEIDELESDNAEFSNMYDILLQECVSNDVKCSYLYSLSDLDAHAELKCLYLHKVKECECLAQNLSKQTETVSKEVYNELS